MILNAFLEKKEHSCFIDGQFISSGQSKITLTNPTTKSPWKTILTASKEDTQHAINAAQAAFSTWKWVPPPVRGKYLRQCGDLLLQYQDQLAAIMAMEMGKPITEGKKEVDYSAGFFHWFAGEAERIYGKTIPSQFPEKRLMLIYEPVGVAGLITPWNFPLAMPARKIAAALAAGCTTILKPSAECPLSVLALAHIFQMIDLPKGVFNVLVGDEQMIGHELLSSPIVRKIGFTGSSEVGKTLYQHSAQTLKKLTLELGGHAPVLVFVDADFQKAIDGIITAKFRNNGQTCVAANRVFVHEKIYKAFSQQLVDRIKKLKVGDPLDPSTELSTVIHPSVTKKVPVHVEDAIKKGAKVLLKGEKPHEPTILGDVTPDMLIFEEETFGPVLPLIPFKDIQEGIALANQSPYGLAAYVYTEDMTTGHLALGALEYGIIGLNDGLPSTPQGVFGGVKESGFGREGGPTGLYEYCTEKFISIRIY